MFEDLTTAMWGVVNEIGEIMLSPGRRAFWPFFLASIAIGFVVLWAQTRSVSGAVQKIREAFGLRVWLHRSSLMDLRLIVFNAFLRTLLLPVITLSALTVVVLIVGALTAVFGEPTPTTWPQIAITSLYTVVLFVVWDLSRFVLHAIAHEVDFVWEFHKIHHSAEVLTPLSIYRSHPVEVYLFALRGALATGIVTGVFYYFFRGQALQYEFLGANAIGWLFNAIGSNLRHTNVWFPYPRFIEHVFMSPAQHQIHHGDKEAEYKSNYGAFLAVWDWMFGSLYLAADHKEPVIFGLKEEDNNHHPASVWSSVLGPFVALANRFKPSRSVPTTD